MTILYANPAFSRLVNTKTITEKTFRSVWPHAEAASLIKKLKSTAPPEYFVLPLHKHKEDTPPEDQTWIQFKITPDTWNGEECYILWGMDISPLYTEVQKADAMAEMKSNFLATMSHEIRTPMQTIYGLLELIEREEPSAPVLDMLSIAQTSASSMLEILDDVLDIAKMDADKMELDIFEVPVRMLVRGTLEALEVKAQSGKVKIRDDIAEDVPFVVIGDPKRLRQVIMNLAGNALKFTEKGSVTVRVTTQTEHIQPRTDQVGLRFEVIDTGMGMTRETCDKLFSSFTQADNSTSRKFGGTGLGLSISKKLVELMGGTIGVHSTPGKGSTFWFEIPTEEVDTETTSIELPCLDGISVLSVEDHPMGAKEIMNSLRSMGATVESCPTYTEGLDLVTRRPFDVAVIDQGLPDGLGLDLIREIIDTRPQMGLIMYTVRDDVGLQHTLQALGVTYLSKPASRAGLGEAVKDAANKATQITVSGPVKLLIAEDTESIRDIIKRQLDTLGVDASFTTNGREALEALSTGEYGILITDLHMPEMDGYELVRTLRDTEEKTDQNRFPIIALTADVQMAQRETYLKNGFDECLLKPVSLGQFRQLLVRWGLLTLPDAVPPADTEDAKEPTDDTSQAVIDQTNQTPDSPIDLEAMKRQMGAVDEGAIDMLKMFVDMTRPLIKKIEDAHEHTDYDDLREAAHSLKGAARSACCNALGEVAATLQDEADNKAPCHDLVQQIRTEFSRVEHAVSDLKIS